MDAPPVQYVKTSDGYNIAYSVSGEGLPFVMMPYLDAWSTERLWKSPSWRNVFEPLAQRFQLIQYDSRGTGNSTRGLKPGHSSEDYVLDLEAVVDRLGLDFFVLHAVLFAAHPALQYLARHPTQLAGLILQNPMPIEGAVGLRNWERLYTNNWENFVQGWTRTFYPQDGEDWGKIYGEMTSQTDHLLMAQAMIDSRVDGILPHIDTPVLITGPNIFLPNPAIPDAARAYASLIPNSQLLLHESDGLTMDITLVVEQFVNSLPPSHERKPVANPQLDNLSERELEVLRLVAQGKSNPEIAKALFITRNTVQNHVSSILIKTNLTNRAQAAVYAQQHGLV